MNEKSNWRDRISEITISVIQKLKQGNIRFTRKRVKTTINPDEDKPGNIEAHPALKKNKRPEVTPDNVVAMLEKGSPKSVKKKAEEGATMMDVVRRQGGGENFISTILSLAVPIIDDLAVDRKEKGHLKRIKEIQVESGLNEGRARSWSDTIDIINAQEGRNIIKEIERQVPNAQKAIRAYWASTVSIKITKRQLAELEENLDKESDSNGKKKPSMTPGNARLSKQKAAHASELLLAILKTSRLGETHLSESGMKSMTAFACEDPLPAGNIRRALRSRHVPEDTKKRNIDRFTKKRALILDERSKANAILAAAEITAGSKVFADYADVFSGYEKLLERWVRVVMKMLYADGNEADKFFSAGGITSKTSVRTQKGKFITDVEDLKMFFEEFIAQMEARKKHTSLIAMAFTRELFQRLYDQYKESPDRFMAKMISDTGKALGRHVTEK